MIGQTAENERRIVTAQMDQLQLLAQAAGPRESTDGQTDVWLSQESRPNHMSKGWPGVRSWPRGALHIRRVDG
jgi:hypothetical protein